VIDHHKAGDLAARDAAYADVMRVFSMSRWPGGSVRFNKAAMNVLGYGGYHLRAPYDSLDAAAHKEIEAGFGKLNAKRWL
jgi:dihydrodipicolinate synthase/N-acetylneuraminate lyase